MGDARRVRCKTCRKHTSEVGSISWNGNCIPCAKAREAASIYEQVAHNGPTFDRWRRQIAASVGGVLLDDLREGA